MYVVMCFDMCMQRSSVSIIKLYLLYLATRAPRCIPKLHLLWMAFRALRCSIGRFGSGSGMQSGCFFLKESVLLPWARDRARSRVAWDAGSELG